MVLSAGFKYHDVESVADAVGGAGHASDAGADDGDSGPGENRFTAWGLWREDFAYQPLQQLEDEEDGVKKGVVYLRFAGHFDIVDTWGIELEKYFQSMDKLKAMDRSFKHRQFGLGRRLPLPSKHKMPSLTS